MSGTKGVTQSKTIWGGVIASLSALVMLGQAVSGMLGVEITAEEATQLQANTESMVFGIAGLVGGALAIYGRFKAKTSVKVGGGSKPSSNLPLVLIGCLSLVTLGGCDAIGGRSNLEMGAVNSWGRPSSTSTMNNDGEQLADYMGESPTQIKLDEAGIYKTTGGKTRTFGINPATGTIFADSSEDISIGKFEYIPQPEPGQASLIITDLSGRQTELTQASIIGLAAAIAALEGMTQQQAQVVIEKWKTAGLVTEAVAKAALESFNPAP